MCNEFHVVLDIIFWIGLFVLSLERKLRWRGRHRVFDAEKRAIVGEEGEILYKSTITACCMLQTKILWAVVKEGETANQIPRHRSKHFVLIFL